MYIRFSALLPAAALAAVVAAAPTELEARTDSSQCNTGPIQCCNNTYQSDTTISQLLRTIGIDLPDISGLIGLGCTPITVIGTGNSASCSQQPVCCDGNTFNGLINLGRSPIDLNL